MPMHNPTWYGWFETVNGVALITVARAAVGRVGGVGSGTPPQCRRRHVGVADVAGRGGHRLRDGAVGMDDHVGGRPGQRREPGPAAGPAHDVDEPDRRQPAAFAALGFFAPLRFAALASVPRILALAAGCSVLVETAQYFMPDRVSSVDDVLLNAAGAGLAALASRHWWRARADASPHET